jgi:hypothetical protein
MEAALQLNPVPEFVPMPPPVVDELAVQTEEVKNAINLSVSGGNAWYSTTGTAITYPSVTWNTGVTNTAGGGGYYTLGSASTAATTATYTYSIGGTDTGTTIYLDNPNPTVWVNSAAAGSTYTITNGTISGNVISWAPLSKEEQVKQAVKQMVRKRLTPEERRHRQYLEAMKTPQEQKARDSLRDILSENDWRRYVTNGFVMVRGPSGKFYQVFANRSHTQVFEKGKNVASLCIHSDASCPPTDHVINMKLLIEMDEALVWHGANITWKNGTGLSAQGFIVNGTLGVYGNERDYSQGKSNLVELVRAVKSA